MDILLSMNKEKVNKAYPNGVCVGSGATMCRKNLPKIKYNVAGNVWTLYLNYEGERTRVSFSSVSDALLSEYVTYLKKWFVIGAEVFKKAVGAGLGGVRLEPRKDLAKRSGPEGDALERINCNLRYYAKYKARYEYFKLFKSAWRGYSESEIEERYLHDVNLVNAKK